MRVKKFAALNAAFFLSISPTIAQQSHGDAIINYLACDGTHQGPPYSAKWIGDTFEHIAQSGSSHGDRVINYVTWDGKCWQAYWDPASDTFVHKRFPGGEDQHADILLNYRTWDGSNWSATRLGNGFYHVYVSPPGPYPSPNVIKQVSTWLERNKKTVDIAMKIAEALSKMAENQ